MESALPPAPAGPTPSFIPPKFRQQPLTLPEGHLERLTNELVKANANPQSHFQVVHGGGQPVLLTDSFALKFTGGISQESEFEAMNIYRALGENVPPLQPLSLLGSANKPMLTELTQNMTREASFYTDRLTRTKALQKAQKKVNYRTDLSTYLQLDQEIQALDPFGEGFFQLSKVTEKCDLVLKDLNQPNSILLATRVQGEPLKSILSSTTHTAQLFEGEGLPLKALMYQLGRIAIKDLVTGNFDRLCQLQRDPKTDTMKLSVSLNEGNLLLDPSKGIEEAGLVCIDNSVTTEPTAEDFRAGIKSELSRLPSLLWAELKDDHFTSKVDVGTREYESFAERVPDADALVENAILCGIKQGLLDIAKCPPESLPPNHPALLLRLEVLKEESPHLL